MVAEKNGEMSTCFYIGDLFKKARPGDKLLIEFYPNGTEEENFPIWLVWDCFPAVWKEKIKDNR